MGLSISWTVTNHASVPVIWRFSDGRAGHDSQSNGLCQFLKGHYDCEILHFECPSIPQLLFKYIAGSFPAANKQATPDLLVGAGHATHLPLLLARHRTGAPCLVIMKPSLPLPWFDLCLIPEHDEVKPADNIINTCGALNTVYPATALTPDKGLIMIGGPSKRHGWNTEKLIKEIDVLVKQTSTVHWHLTDSPRTPVETRHALAQLTLNNLTYVPYHESDKSWLQGMLGVCGIRWITEDSISMIYESLTAGGNAYIFQMPRLREDKVTASLDTLYQSGHLQGFETWQQNESGLKHMTLNESARCAALVYKRFLAHPEATPK